MCFPLLKWNFHCWKVFNAGSDGLLGSSNFDNFLPQNELFLHQKPCAWKVIVSAWERKTAFVCLCLTLSAWNLRALLFSKFPTSTSPVIFIRESPPGKNTPSYVIASKKAMKWSISPQMEVCGIQQKIAPKPSREVKDKLKTATIFFPIKAATFLKNELPLYVQYNENDIVQLLKRHFDRESWSDL